MFYILKNITHIFLMLNGFYINLDGRRDRFDYFEKVKSDNSFLINIQRFSAIQNSNGGINK